MFKSIKKLLTPRYPPEMQKMFDETRIRAWNIELARIAYEFAPETYLKIINNPGFANLSEKLPNPRWVVEMAVNSMNLPAPEEAASQERSQKAKALYEEGLRLAQEQTEKYESSVWGRLNKLVPEISREETAEEAAEKIIEFIQKNCVKKETQ